MTKKLYVGVNSVARKVKKYYVGVSGVARKVKKAYIGVNGVARQYYSSDWWTPSGVSLTNVIAAYQFKGASSETVSRNDLSGHGKTLTLSGTGSWSSSGYYLNGGYLYNTSMYNLSDVKSIVIRYSGLNTTTTFIPLSEMYMPANTSGTKPNLYAHASWSRFYNGAWLSTSYNAPAAIVGWSNDMLYYYLANSSLPATGTVGYSGGTFYSNGSSIGGTYKSENAENLSTIEIGNTNQNGLVLSSRNGYGYTVIAAAYFSVALTPAQQSEIYNLMAQI